MSEMRNDLRQSVTRFCYPALTLFWFWVAHDTGFSGGGWLFAALGVWCGWRTVVVWRKDRNEL
jgi:hypothetical protein